MWPASQISCPHLFLINIHVVDQLTCFSKVYCYASNGIIELLWMEITQLWQPTATKYFAQLLTVFLLCRKITRDKGATREQSRPLVVFKYYLNAIYSKCGNCSSSEMAYGSLCCAHPNSRSHTKKKCSRLGGTPNRKNNL